MDLSNNRPLLENKRQPINYTFWGVVLVALALVAGVGYFGYNWYIANREEKAQQMFSDCMQEYMQVQSGRGTWQTIQDLSTVGYEQNKSSYLAPYFLSLNAEALVQQKKGDQAVAVLDDMLSKLTPSSSLYGLFGLKRALINLDSQDKEMQKKGLEQLHTLCQDTKNNNRDAALYYVGLYHWVHDEIESAHKAWQELITVSSKGQQAPSPWAAIAQGKMKAVINKS